MNSTDRFIYFYIYIYSLHNLSSISSTYFRNVKHNTMEKKAGKESSLRTHVVRVLTQARISNYVV